MYDSVRESDTDICNIAKNLNIKKQNIRKVKDHVFYNTHNLSRYIGDEEVHKRFSSDLKQSLVWKRLETGTHTLEDITWLKHEYAERHYELKHDSTYSEAHDHVQIRYNGELWDDKF